MATVFADLAAQHDVRSGWKADITLDAISPQITVADYMLKCATLILIIGLLFGCSRPIQVRSGQCWPPLSVGREIEGSARAYVTTHIVTVESGCPHDVLVVLDGWDELASEYNLLKHESGADYDILDFSFPVRFSGRLEVRPHGFSLQVSSIRRIGRIKTTRISELQRHRR